MGEQVVPQGATEEAVRAALCLFQETVGEVREGVERLVGLCEILQAAHDRSLVGEGHDLLIRFVRESKELAVHEATS